MKWVAVLAVPDNVLTMMIITDAENLLTASIKLALDWTSRRLHAVHAKFPRKEAKSRIYVNTVIP